MSLGVWKISAYFYANTFQPIISNISQCKHKISVFIRGWKDGSAVKSTGCFFRKPRLISQLLHNPSLAPVPEDPMLPSYLHIQTCSSYTYTDTCMHTNSHKIVIIFKMCLWYNNVSYSCLQHSASQRAVNRPASETEYKPNSHNPHVEGLRRLEQSKGNKMRAGKAAMQFFKRLSSWALGNSKSKVLGEKIRATRSRGCNSPSPASLICWPIEMLFVIALQFSPLTAGKAESLKNTYKDACYQLGIILNPLCFESQPSKDSEDFLKNRISTHLWGCA